MYVEDEHNYFERVSASNNIILHTHTKQKESQGILLFILKPWNCAINE